MFVDSALAVSLARGWTQRSRNQLASSIFPTPPHPIQPRQLPNRLRFILQADVGVEIHGYGILMLPSTTNSRGFAGQQLPNFPQCIWFIWEQVASDGLVLFGLEGSLADLVLNP